MARGRKPFGPARPRARLSPGGRLRSLGLASVDRLEERARARIAEHVRAVLDGGKLLAMNADGSYRPGLAARAASELWAAEFCGLGDEYRERIEEIIAAIEYTGEILEHRRRTESGDALASASEFAEAVAAELPDLRALATSIRRDPGELRHQFWTGPYALGQLVRDANELLVHGRLEGAQALLAMVAERTGDLEEGRRNWEARPEDYRQAARVARALAGRDEPWEGVIEAAGMTRRDADRVLAEAGVEDNAAPTPTRSASLRETFSR